MTGSFRIELLSERHDRAGFTCGVEALDRYLQRQVGQDARRRIASCFVLASEAGAIAGYFTLAATGLALDDLPDAVTRKLPRYPTVPATLLGRLAVALTHRGKGFGETLLYDAMYRTLSNEIATFALIVDPKDENASRFYGYYQFLPLRNSSPRMYLPVSEIAALFP